MAQILWPKAAQITSETDISHSRKGVGWLHLLDTPKQDLY